MLTSTLSRLQPLVALVVSAICLWALWHQVSDVSWAELSATLRTISIWQWTAALAATTVSFWAIGHYDVVWHNHMKTGVSPIKAHRTGMATVAIAQAVGMGTVAGSFLRWHLLRGLPFRVSVTLTIAIALSFFGCWAVLAILAASRLGLIPIALTVAVLVVAGVAVRVLPRHPVVARHSAKISRLMLWSTVDIVFAAFALWVLLPETVGVGFGVLCAAFTLALGAGLVSNAPGGLGAFDLALVALLPAVPDATLLATILGFRVVYYAVPALFGAGVLFASHLRNAPLTITKNNHPLSDLCHQGATLLADRNGTHVARRHFIGTVVLEPRTWDFARSQQPIFVQSLYKCPASVAARARVSGWTVRRIASDAIVTPRT
ncbi:MAG: YbhN family protein [Pseudomonadota bacterium]